MRKRFALFTVILMATATMPLAAASAGPASCDKRVNNNIDKLLECVNVEGVREHQAALQAIADENWGYPNVRHSRVRRFCRLRR